jgi:hypothetical protein
LFLILCLMKESLGNFMGLNYGELYLWMDHQFGFSMGF